MSLFDPQCHTFVTAVPDYSMCNSLCSQQCSNAMDVKASWDQGRPMYHRVLEQHLKVCQSNFYYNALDIRGIVLKEESSGEDEEERDHSFGEGVDSDVK